MSHRPLSPHLQVYKPQMTSVLSIIHRATGIVISLGALMIAGWLWSIAIGGDSYKFIHGFLASVPGTVLIWAWVVCSSYHLLNGIRHLLWDVGIGFEINQAYMTGKLVLLFTVVIVLLVWFL